MKIMAIDIGFSMTGFVIMERDDKGIWSIDYKGIVATSPVKSRQNLYQAHMDTQRMVEAGRTLTDIVRRHGVNRFVVEIPGAGANNFRAGRCMALASGMIAGVVGAVEGAVEWYSPEQTRSAAIPDWRKRRLRGGDLKRAIVGIMGQRYPEISALPTAEQREAVADALATFDAALGGNLVRAT